VLIDIERALKEIGYKKVFNVSYDDLIVKNHNSDFKAKPFSFSISVENKSGNALEIFSDFVVAFDTVCDRCLTDTEIKLPILIEEELRLVNHTIDYDDDNAPFIEGEYLDTDKLLHEWILLNMPSKVLCSNDCKGICYKCGKNLNIGDCGCDRTSTSLQMEKFKEIFDKFKEV